MQGSSNPAFRNMEKVIGSQQQAAPSAQYLDQMYNQPSYQAPARERFLTVDGSRSPTAPAKESSASSCPVITSGSWPRVVRTISTKSARFCASRVAEVATIRVRTAPEVVMIAA